MGNIESAIIDATYAHLDQKDKGGHPYILHSLSVMFRVRAGGWGEAYQIVAVLHGVVEDTGTSLEGVFQKYGEEVANAVKALTKDRGEDYRIYIKRVGRNAIARVVKMEDLRDNLDPMRDCITPEMRARYEAALIELTRLDIKAKLDLEEEA